MFYTCYFTVFTLHCDRDNWSNILRAHVGGVEFEKHRITAAAAAAKKKRFLVILMTDLVFND